MQRTVWESFPSIYGRTLDGATVCCWRDQTYIGTQEVGPERNSERGSCGQTGPRVCAGAASQLPRNHAAKDPSGVGVTAIPDANLWLPKRQCRDMCRISRDLQTLGSNACKPGHHAVESCYDDLLVQQGLNSSSQFAPHQCSHQCGDSPFGINELSPQLCLKCLVATTHKGPSHLSRISMKRLARALLARERTVPKESMP